MTKYFTWCRKTYDQEGKSEREEHIQCETLKQMYMQLGQFCAGLRLLLHKTELWPSPLLDCVILDGVVLAPTRSSRYTGFSCTELSISSLITRRKMKTNLEYVGNLENFRTSFLFQEILGLCLAFEVQDNFSVGFFGVRLSVFMCNSSFSF